MSDDRLWKLHDDLNELTLRTIEIEGKLSQLNILETKITQLNNGIDVINGKLAELRTMKTNITELKNSLNVLSNSVEKDYYDLQKRIPKTNIISQSLWKRMWAVAGHFYLAHTILYPVLLVLSLLLGGAIAFMQ